jgi:hypothetical protein
VNSNGRVTGVSAGATIVGAGCWPCVNNDWVWVRVTEPAHPPPPTITSPTLSVNNININRGRDVTSFTANITVNHPSTQILISVRCADTDTLIAGFEYGTSAGGTITTDTFVEPTGIQYRVRGVAVINGERYYSNVVLVDAR